MLTWRQALLSICFGVGVSACAHPALAECTMVRYDNPVVHLRASEAVYVAQVESVTTNEAGWPTAEVRVVRSWKGSAKRHRWRGATVSVGEYYLVYALPDWDSFEAECDYRPIPLREAAHDITLLNRYRGYSRLVVPTPKKDR